MNQIGKGFNERFFGNPNANSCTPKSTRFARGRNYWDKDTDNGYVTPPGETPLGYQELPTQNTHFDKRDPRIVTIFLAPTQAFGGSGQNVFPITGFIEVYITGYGRISGNGSSVTPDDPCPGSAGPSNLNLGGGNAGGYAVWGHVLNFAIPVPNATPSGVICNPGGSTQPCVAVLVE
jgi:hypothetical protein